MQRRSGSAAETRALARALATALCEEPGAQQAGPAVALVGALGAGKTVFAKGLGEGFGIAPEHMASPTFVLANEFALAPGCGFARLVHADFYRMESEAELEAAGLLDWLGPGALLVAEWADRFPAALPADHLEVRLESAGSGMADARILQARAGGGAARRVLLRWAAQCP